MQTNAKLRNITLGLITAGLSFSLANQAQAAHFSVTDGAFAISINDVTDFNIVIEGTTSGTDTSVYDGSSRLESLSSAAVIPPGTFFLDSDSDIISGAPPVEADAVESCVESGGANVCGGTAENDYAPTGPRTDEGRYARGDAISTAGTGGQIARNVAESYVRSNGEALAEGKNVFNGTFEITEESLITVSFNATPYISGFVSSDLNPAESASSATLNFGVTIREEGTGPFSIPLWVFAPDGDLDAGEASDPFTLNTGDGTVGVPDSYIFNPGTGYFESSVVLAIGTYDINVEGIETTRVTAVPEPATLGLFGAGLIGIAAARRRAKQFS